MALTKFKTTPVFTKAMAALPYDPELAFQTTFKTRYGDIVKLGYKEGDLFYVPREMVFEYGEDLRSLGDRVDLEIKFPPKNQQQEEILAKSWGLLERDQSHILQAGTGTGKCLGKDTPVIMFDGTIRKVQEISSGDLLLGPDGTPRAVTGVTQGHGPLFKVTPNTGGDPFVCNDVHVLSLKRTRFYQKNGGGSNGHWRGGDVVNIPLNEYLEQSNKFKHLMKLWRPEHLEFQSNHELTVPPYLLGVLLGDGGLTQNVRVSSADKEIEDELEKYAKSYGLSLSMELGVDIKCREYTFSSGRNPTVPNRLRNQLTALGLMGLKAIEKHIPQQYLVASTQDRLELLAGLLDTDGSLTHNGFDVSFSSKRLAEGTAFLARSLGFSVSRAVRETTHELSYRMHITGHTDKIPVRITRKRAGPRLQKKNPCMTGFKVEALGDGDYFGFQLDGDHLFLLGDFTVTHNTYLSLNLAARLGRRTLIVVTKDRMMQQWKDEISQFLGIPQDQIGHIQQNKMTCKDKPVTVAMLHSLARDKYADWVKDYFGFIIFDEIHNLGAESFCKVAGMFSAKYRLGLSATPKRSDTKEFIFMSHIGQVGVVANQTLMSPKVIVTNTSFKLPLVTRKDPVRGIIKVPYPIQKGKLGRVNTFLATNAERNEKIINFVKQAYEKGRYTVVFTDLVDKHIKPLRALLIKAGIPVEDIGMFSRSAVGLNVLDEQKFKKVVLTTYGQCAEAINVPRWDTAVLALPRANVKQIVGRVLREHNDKSHPVIFDLVDSEVSVLREYYRSRYKIYQELGAEVLTR